MNSVTNEDILSRLDKIEKKIDENKVIQTSLLIKSTCFSIGSSIANGLALGAIIGFCTLIYDRVSK